MVAMSLNWWTEKNNPFCPKKRENLFVMLTTATFKHERADIDRKEASKQWQNVDNIDGS